MKSFYLDFSLYKEDGKIKLFIEDIEEFENNLKILEQGKIKEPIGNIYIDCSGGENRSASILYYFLKEKKDNYNFIISGQCSSNAFMILLALNPKNIIITRQATCICHLSNYEQSVNEIVFSKEKDIHAAYYFNFKKFLNLTIDCFKFFMTKEELNILKEGRDICISPNRLVEIFKKLKYSKLFQKKTKNIFEITL